jgi:3,4-dihydroxy 2-butanone 4-phosphate synthase/GTP cyclohydrolase II
MARGEELTKLANTLKCKIITIKDLVTHVQKHPLSPLPKTASVTRISSARLPTRYGAANIVAYASLRDGREHAALVFGKPRAKPLVRIHSSCLTGDALFSLKCDCGEQLKEAMRRMQHEGSGILVYVSQEGRGIGLANKVKAYALQDKGYDTVEANHALGFKADPRTYEEAADILRDLGASEIRLLTNNPEKVAQLSKHGIRIVKAEPIEIAPNAANRNYLKTKKKKLGHTLRVV